LPKLKVQYVDFTSWQRQALKEDSMAEHLSYWKQQLAGAPPLLELPTDRPRPSIQTYRGARHAIELTKPTIEALAILGRGEGCTLFMVLLAAFNALLTRYTRREDIIVGSPIANRSRAEFEPLIGYFLNTLVFRANLSSDPTFRQLLGRVRELALAAYAHQDLPFEKLVAELQPVRDVSFSPIFQVMFVLQNPLPAAQAGELKLTPFEIDPGTSKLDFTLSLEPTPQGCSGWIEYATDLFDVSTIQSIAKAFQILLTEIVARPDDRLSELAPGLEKTERWTARAPSQAATLPEAGFNYDKDIAIPRLSR
jgi:non-ribosomal peptide synthetase component F